MVPITWGEILGKGKKIAHRYPFEGQIWYPDGDIRNSKFVHNLIVFFFHIIPAYFIDFLMLIFRQKRLWVFFSSNFHRSIYFFRLFSFRGYVSRLRNSVILFHARVSFFCYYYILIFFFFLAWFVYKTVSRSGLNFYNISLRGNGFSITRTCWHCGAGWTPRTKRSFQLICCPSTTMSI